jgi:hypothetical protein
MNAYLLLTFEPDFLMLAGGLLAVYLGFQFMMGHLRFKDKMAALRDEGILREEGWVFTRIRFPLMRRITFSHVYLSAHRIVLFRSLTRSLILQAPPGQRGSTGKPEGRFELEARGQRTLLTFHTPTRGGGRIRLHVKDPEAWIGAIRDQGPEKGTD